RPGAVGTPKAAANGARDFFQVFVVRLAWQSRFSTRSGSRQRQLQASEPGRPAQASCAARGAGFPALSTRRRSKGQSDQGAVMIRKLSPRSRARRDIQRQARRLSVEVLEDRCLLTGTWTPLTNLLPDTFGAATEMLLSDGTVMILGGGDVATSKNWYKLTPDANGSYVNGTFSPRAPMSLARIAFPSNVLPS